MTQAIKIVKILFTYLIKNSGSVVYKVRNGDNKIYCVTFNTNGTTGCYDTEAKETCKGCQYGKKCYHIKLLQAAYDARFVEEVVVESVEEALEVARNAQQAPYVYDLEVLEGLEIETVDAELNALYEQAQADDIVFVPEIEESVFVTMPNGTKRMASQVNDACLDSLDKMSATYHELQVAWDARPAYKPSPTVEELEKKSSLVYRPFSFMR